MARFAKQMTEYGRKIGLEKDFLAPIVPVVVELMGGVYHEIADRRGYIEKIVASEEDKFRRTLDAGLQRLEDQIKQMIVERCFLDVDPGSIGDDEPLLERRDIDSLKLFEIVVGAEEQFGISVAGEEFSVDNFRTVRDIAECVRRNQR